MAINFEEIGRFTYKENSKLFPKLNENNLFITSVKPEQTNRKVCGSGWNSEKEKFIVYYSEQIFLQRFLQYNLQSNFDQVTYVKTCFLHEFFHSETNIEESKQPNLKDLFCHECDIKVVEHFPKLKKCILNDWPRFEEEKESVKEQAKLLRNSRFKSI